MRWRRIASAPTDPWSDAARVYGTVAGLALVAILLVVATQPPGAPSTTAACDSLAPGQIDTTTPIQHLFVIIKENHGFDNYFATLPGVVGNPPSGTLPIAWGSSQTIQPFALSGTSTPSLPNSAYDYRADWNGGAMNGFVAEANLSGASLPADAAGYYTAEQVGPYFAYAENYSVGDEFFTGVLGPTYPNRIFDLGATQLDGWNNDTPPPANVTLEPTVLDQLDAARIPWAYDYAGVPGFLAPTEFPTLNTTECARERIDPIASLAVQLSGPSPPAVTVVDPSNLGTYSEHPPSNVTQGAFWTADVVNTILESPVAATSAILIFYDEDGGYWDPVAPPMTSTGMDGFRVPFIAISPWTPAGTVCSGVLDPAAVVRFIDQNWGLPTLNARIGAAGSLGCFFNFSMSPRSPLILPTNVSAGIAPAVAPGPAAVSHGLGVLPDRSATPSSAASTGGPFSPALPVRAPRLEPGG